MLRRTVVTSGLSPLLAKNQLSGVRGSTRFRGESPISELTTIHASIAGIAKEIHTKFSSFNHLFVRSSIGSGKSSLAFLLRQAAPKHVWLLDENWDLDISFLANIQRACDGEGQRLGDLHAKGTTITELLGAIKDDLLIIDECHLMFACDGAPGFQAMFKGKEGATPHILLLSSSGAAQKAAEHQKVTTVPTPAVIKNKEFIDFSLNLEEVEKLLQLSVTITNRQVETRSYSRLAHIIFRYHQGHKLLTMQAIDALCCSLKSKYVNESAVMQACVSKAVTESRAAIVNCRFGENPGCLRAAALLLGHGFIKPSKLSESVSIGALLVRGAVVPLQQHPSAKSMLTAPAENESDPVHVSSNPLALRNMVRTLKIKHAHTLPVVCEIGGAEDVVLLGLGYLDFIFGDGDFLRTTQLASEITNQLAFERAFKLGGMEERFESSRELSYHRGAWLVDQVYKKGDRSVYGGIIDHRVIDKSTNKTYFVEMLERGDLVLHPSAKPSKEQQNIIEGFQTTVRDHVERFHSKPTYQEALNCSDGVAVVVYTPSSSAEKAKKEVKESFGAAVKTIKNAEKKKEFRAKMAGVVLEELSCWEYNVFIIKYVGRTWRVFPLGRVLSDCIARRFVVNPMTNDGKHIAINQRLPTDLEVCQRLNRPMALASLTTDFFADERLFRGTPADMIPTMSVWVQQRLSLIHI